MSTLGRHANPPNPSIDSRYGHVSCGRPGVHRHCVTHCNARHGTWPSGTPSTTTNVEINDQNTMKHAPTDRRQFLSNWIVPLLLLMLGGAAIASGVVRFSSITPVLSSGVVPEDEEQITSYTTHPFISAMHLLPGIAFTVLGPLQLAPAVRRRWPGVHRWSGRVFVLSGLLTGISAISMAVIFPVLVSRVSTVANIVTGVAMIVALVVAFRAILHRDIQRHRIWMVWAYAIGLTVATIGVFPPTR